MQGRKRTYFEHFWNDFAADKTHSILEADRVSRTEAYSMAPQMKLAASDVTFVVLKDTGHWLMEEHPQGTMAALVKSL